VLPARIAFASIRPELQERLTPIAAGWYAGEDPHIVSVEFPVAEQRLHGTRVRAAARAGLLRTSWHVHNTDDDVRELLELLGR
jgi:hypothetical protein